MNNIWKPLTTEEAHQAKRASFSFPSVGHARVRSMGPTPKAHIGLKVLFPKGDRSSACSIQANLGRTSKYAILQFLIHQLITLDPRFVWVERTIRFCSNWSRACPVQLGFLSSPLQPFPKAFTYMKTASMLLTFHSILIKLVIQPIHHLIKVQYIISSHASY